jgi:hypothetical protein
MKRYKFQAMVTPAKDDDGEVRAKLASGSCRMVLRAENSETKRTQVFSALVDPEQEGSFRPGKPTMLVTLRVIGDDIADYLDIGSHFSLWQGIDIGQGVITRRLFV